MHQSLRIIVTLGVIFLGACSRNDPMGDFDSPLIGGYYLVRESLDSVEVLHMRDSDKLGVPAKVVEIAWNDRYIVAKQQQLKLRGKFPNDALPVPAPGMFDYWIIDVGQTNRYGPLSVKEFTEKMQSLGQLGLKLEDVSRIKKR